jgi:hypothetical protein
MLPTTIHDAGCLKFIEQCGSFCIVVHSALWFIQNGDLIHGVHNDRDSAQQPLLAT